MSADDTRIGLLEGRVIDSKLGRQVSPQIVEHSVGGANEIEEDAPALSAFQVDPDRALVPVEGLEELAISRAKKMWSDSAAEVSALRHVLDLDHFGSEVRQVQRTPGSRTVLFDGKNPESGERKHRVLQTGLRATSWRAIMIRCNSLVPSPMHSNGASR